MNERNCPTCNQTKNIPTLLAQCFNCWYTSSPQEKENSFQTLLTKLEQDPDQTLNWLYADAHSGQFVNHPEQTWEQLTQELTTERETTQQALQTSQEWHERQKEEIIAEWKQKLTNLIQQRKNQIIQELTLLRNLLNHE